MTHDEYAALVSRLESVAGAHPGAYRLRVGALAIMGYVYVLGLLLVLIALLVLLVWGLVTAHLSALVLKLAIPVLALVVALGRALWVRIPPPEGRVLRRAEAPALFDEIDAVRRAVKAPAPHRVIVTDVLNAAVSQVPRLGIFGWHRNYLVLGLPLLTALTPEQFQAVLAHEFGHLSRAHARFANWIYRVRGTWDQVVAAIQHRRSRLGALLVNRFVEWYVPYFGAYSFVLARAHETEADRISADVAGSTTAGTALLALALRARYQSEIVWPGVTSRIVDEPVPPRAAFAGLVQAMPAALPTEYAGPWLASSLSEASDFTDPHPSLAARLEALGQLPSGDAAITAIAEELAQPIDPSATAAARYLGPLAATLASELDEQWRSEVSARWTDRHRHLVRARDGLRELAARAEQGPLEPGERYRMADWTEDIHGADAALPIVKALVDDEPEHASALFMLGRLFLARGDEAGIDYIERAIRIDPSATATAASMIAAYLRGVGRGEDATAYEARAAAAAYESAAAKAERRGIAQREKLTSAALDDAACARLHEQLARHPQVGRAWIARKVTHHAPEHPFYILGVSRAEPWWRFVSEGSSTYLARKLIEEVDLPDETLVVVLGRKQRWLRRKLKRVPRSEVYRRGRGARVAARPLSTTPPAPSPTQ
ncbi:MAG TPA: M48 family metalloprotease [Gemmatimonadaceae bacterium]